MSKGQKWGRVFNILVSCYVLFLISCNVSGCQSCQGTEGTFLRHISIIDRQEKVSACAYTRICGGIEFVSFYSRSEEKIKC